MPMPRTRLNPRTALRLAYACDAVISNGDGILRLAVTDDGAWFDGSSTSYGTGLQDIADRLAALGDGVDARSEPGHGTTVVGTLPVEVTP